MNGSPPRAWGRPARRVERVEVVRFTPTCVGTTHRARDRRRAHSVHPHVRGDDARSERHERPMIGSPPRAWGRPDLERLQKRGDRFTPTCVGTTTTIASSRAWTSVHPHVRGDDVVIAVPIEPQSGSPPRAWGRRELGRGLAPLLRFTPTCVGTTWSIPRTRAAASVHPHVRGDDPPPSTKVGETHGSPPRAWGRLRGRGLGQDPRRFTPTCVGTTRVATALSHSTPVHPHVRGDDSISFQASCHSDGSPPRAWGRR